MVMTNAKNEKPVTEKFLQGETHRLDAKIDMAYSELNAKVEALSVKVDSKPSEEFVYRMYNELDEKIDNLSSKFDTKFDEIMNILIDILGQFKKFDEEQTVIAHRIANHEDRIVGIEKTLHS